MSTARISAPPRRRPVRYPGTGPLAGAVALVLLAALFLVPVYVLMMAALKPPVQADAVHMWELPESIDFSGVEQAWEKLSPNVRNSLLMVLPATIVSSLVGALNGFVLAKLPFRGAKVLFAAMLLGMFIPYQVILVPLVRFLQSVDLYGTLPGLILVHIIYGIPITTLIFRNYFNQLPHEMVEAARVDGCSNAAIFLRVMLPLSLPGFVVCAIFQFTNIWNDFLFGITVVPDPTQQPVTVALNNLAGNFSVQWNTVMAGALLAALPTALVYILLGRFFVRGLTAGSVK
ncbi:carbohydrate ABC transporter permease [Streptomyces sporangiiformans]|uniref:Carbohydrate ABC transporter permease n=1 Tax=Streptomyces sporangiiformans TaxID=2315329 RepID=A0A505DRP5_9ACTN|nr:carbohydrate ABC transporter permease [Streptomyces sporangiiformans]TPQ23823.1 carbohydrate ABC transporter permease [Streptomyces sporangiiformans]